ncbi:N-acetylmuramoyl-L-alanine amidase [Kaarinaea lacus]
MYQVKFYKGDYYARQAAANEDQCKLYVEQHFNSSASQSANYSVVVTGYNASQTSKNWGRWYARAVSQEFDIPVGGDSGLLVGGYNGRGDYNLRFTNMPAILLEPFFVSNPQTAEIIKTEAAQYRLASILTESVQRFLPNGGLVGFSIGHKYKTSKPNDRGAAVFGGGTEADIAEAVLLKAQQQLEAIGAAPQEREIKVMQGNEVLWKGNIDFDADVRWDGQRGVLTVS